MTEETTELAVKAIEVGWVGWKYVAVGSPDECWEWMAGRNKLGYGLSHVGGRKGRNVKAHRMVFELLRGPIPDSLELDHLCRNPPCVNPNHLEAVTHAENCRRGIAGEEQRAKTHCPRGHPFSTENTYINQGGNFKNPFRQCRICVRDASRRYAARHQPENAIRTRAWRLRQRELRNG